MLHVFHAKSWNKNVNHVFPVKVYPVDHPLFVTVTHVLLNVILAITFPLVAVLGTYVIAHVTTNLSILLTVAKLLHVLPTTSLNVNINVQFHVNRYHVAFNHVNVSLYPVNVAYTFPLVAHVVE